MGGCIWPQKAKQSMENVKLNFLLALPVMLLSFSCELSAEKAGALFVFGDSYVDTGNRDPYNASANGPWRRPYGFDWPGYPAGRYSSGKILTDRWAEILGLPTPIPYEKLKTHHCEEIPQKTVTGVNFAMGGSGVLHDYGYITISNQAKQFKSLIEKSGVFGAPQLARSVVLISDSGNDYFAYLDSNGNNITGILNLVLPVVSGIVDVVKELYGYGLRNFVLSNVGDLGCFPDVDKSICDSTYDEFVEFHNNLLNTSVHQLKSDLKESNIIILDFLSASVLIFSNATDYGFEDWFKPCCAPDDEVLGCAEVDERGVNLFEMCEPPNERYFWDNRHPTHKGWYILMSLFAYGVPSHGKEVSFVNGASNLIEWVKSIGFDAYNISST